MSSSTRELRDHVREIGKLAEVVGALSKEFDRRPSADVLVVLKARIEALDAEWSRAEVILSGGSR
ncbi:MAG: hypothetical protein HZB53_18345 [Chloroflexi bacterium]|nr:hypothetical protein [Chloroflexota bacterium]